ncbi:MAG TPA: vanadium-dependent haloperoxidase [Vicinamibacterales bacterium]|nr:vanadium-dependent haloperoxidase [Vicinamibacterales bacterium]
MVRQRCRPPCEFRPAGPPDLRSRKWVADYNEVKTFGVKNGSLRFDEQTASALFWEPLAGTVWPATIRRIAREQSLDLATSARFQSAAFAAFADGLIACWDAKCYFNSWRPVTAIPQGETDGNRRTAPDPAWEPLAVTPNFPEYPSGHTCATIAVGHTIEDVLQHEDGLQHLSIPARNIVSGEERSIEAPTMWWTKSLKPACCSACISVRQMKTGAGLGRKIAHQIRPDLFGRKH